MGTIVITLGRGEFAHITDTRGPGRSIRVTLLEAQASVAEFTFSPSHLIYPTRPDGHRLTGRVLLAVGSRLILKDETGEDVAEMFAPKARGGYARLATRAEPWLRVDRPNRFNSPPRPEVPPAQRLALRRRWRHTA